MSQRNQHSASEHSSEDHARHDNSASNESPSGLLSPTQADSGIHGHDENQDHSSHADHNSHQGHGDHVARFRKLFWIMLVIAIPVVGFSSIFASTLGYSLGDTGVAGWISPTLGTVMYIFGGAPFLTGALDELRSKRPGMMLLIGLAITVAFLASWGASLGLLDRALDFWWELALLVVIMLLGHWIEMSSLAQTTSALDSLAALLPDEAERVVGEQTEIVSPSALVLGDVVVVRPGGSVPADGKILEGSASMDEALITGESRPVSRGQGDQVIAGTVATDSGLRVEITAVGDGTALAGIRKLVAEAQSSSSRAQRIADRAAGWLFWFALTAAVLTAIAWTVLGMPDAAVVRTITVLVIACPHALGLAIALVVSISTEKAAKAGVLIKDRLALETMRKVDTVLFDKTGTLTKGSPVVTAVEPASGFEEEEILRLAAAAESDSEHPLAKAIVGSARERKLDVPKSNDFQASPAIGVQATVSKRFVQVGGPYLLEQEGLTELPIAEKWRGEEVVILHVLVDGVVAGALALADEVREESLAAVTALQKSGVVVVMITGDADAIATTVAKQLKIERFFSGVRPEDKASKVKELQQEGRKVAMVGDGVNDAPALAQADVGIAIGAGTDVAIASAGVILASNDPRSVTSVIQLSQKSFRKMKQNLWWAAGYNLISVPLAAGVLASVGFILPMSVGAALMSLSTVIVALNAQLLRRLDLSPDTVTG